MKAACREDQACEEPMGKKATGTAKKNGRVALRVFSSSGGPEHSWGLGQLPESLAVAQKLTLPG